MKEDALGKIRDLLYEILNERTVIFLDYIDGMMVGGNTTLDEINKMEQIKNRGRRMFKECQREILGAIQNIVETGSAPSPVDKRKAND